MRKSPDILYGVDFLKPPPTRESLIKALDTGFCLPQLSHVSTHLRSPKGANLKSRGCFRKIVYVAIATSCCKFSEHLL